MKHYIYLIFSILGTIFVSCNTNYSECKYVLDNYSIARQDWNNCMTKLSYMDERGNVIGSALFYYPGRDGWFLVDNILEKKRVVLVLCDACPKLIINDSLQFVVRHDYSNVDTDKSRWIRISASDDYPVVRMTNNEYGSKVAKIPLSGSYQEMPDWDSYLGKYYER